MKKIIFVDMDGVLSDFESKYVELFGETPMRSRMDKDISSEGKNKFSQNWNTFIEKRAFSILEKHEGCDRLLNALDTFGNVEIKILTSTGGAEHHNDVAMQKIIWVTAHGIKYPVIAVPGRRFKRAFASENTFLIDDTKDVVDSFYNHGGNSVLHYDVDVTISALKEFIND